MKFHIDTHPWLIHARVLVDDLDVSRQCRGVDLETRTLYMHGAPRYAGDMSPEDSVVTLGVTERLRLMLDGHEVMAQGLDLPAAVAQVRQCVADAHSDLGKAPSSEVLGYLLTGIEDALADPDAPDIALRSIDRCLHPVRDRRSGRCPDCGDCTHLVVQAGVCQACAKVLQ